MKRALSWLLVLVMVFSMLPLAAFADGMPSGTVTLQSVDGETHVETWTAPADGTLTVSMGAANPGWAYTVEGVSLQVTGKEATSDEYAVTAGTTYTIVFEAYNVAGWTQGNGTVTYALSFTEGAASTDEPTEKQEYVISETVLTEGDNSVTLNNAVANATIFAFEPTEEGAYTITAGDASAVVGYWGGSEFFLNDPASTSNACQFNCSGVGQIAYIGVSGVDSCTLNVAKTGEDTSVIEWVIYENWENPSQYVYPCLKVVEEQTDGCTQLVNFNHKDMSIIKMLNTTGAKYGDAEQGIYIDYTDALIEYADAAASNDGYVYFTEDLYEMLPRLFVSKGWGNALTSWEDLIVYAVEDHKNIVEETAEDGYTDKYCMDCYYWISSNRPGDMASNPISLDFQNGIETVTLGPWENYYYSVLNNFQMLTVNGEDYWYYEESFDAAEPSIFVLYNESETETVTYQLALRDKTLQEQLDDAGWMLANGEYLPYETTIEGTVSEIASAYNSQYKNITFYVDVDGTRVYCYRVTGEGMDELAVGDTVKVVGNLTAYNSSPQFDKTATVTVLEKAVQEPEDTTGTYIDFAKKEHRVSYSATETVWSNNGVTFTNSKASSSNDLRDPVASGDNHIRIYKGSNVTIEFSGMTKIVFTATGEAKHLTALNDSLQGLGTLAVESNVYTLELESAVDSITIPALAQFRLTKVEVVAGAVEPSEPVPGDSYENPLYPEWTWNDDQTEATLDVEVPAGATTYVAIMFNGLELYINDQSVGTTTGTRWVPQIIGISNTGNAAVQFTLKLSTPIGTMENPEVIDSLFYSSFDVSLAEGDNDGYCYAYTAEGDGQVTFYFNSITEGVEGDIVVTNLNTYAQRSLLADGVDNYGMELVVEVTEGDLLRIQILAVPGADWSVPAAEASWFGTFAAKQGTEANPYPIMDQDYDTEAVLEYSAEIPAGETVYFQGYGLNDTTLVYAGADMTVTVDGVEVTSGYAIPAADGMFAPVMITVTNNAEADGEIAMEFTYAEGTSVNPAELVLGENVAELAEGSEGYHYTWIAPEDGELTLTVSGTNWFYYANYMGDPDSWEDDIYGDQLTYADVIASRNADVISYTQTIEVKKGGLVEVYVNTHDAENPWGTTPAGTVTVTAAFEEPVGPCTHPNLVHVNAVAAGCHMNGNVEHWYCNDCESVWTNAELTAISNHKSVIIPATGDNSLLVHQEAIEPGCHMNGRVEHWICYKCEQVWTDEALTQLSNTKNVILPATGDGLLCHFDAMEPGCHYTGNQEYWMCYTCNQVWTDEALTQLSNVKNVVIPATGSNLLVHNEAIEPGCHYNGCVEHWICYECEQVWTDEALTQLSNIKNVVVPATHNPEAIHVEAKEPTCSEGGNVEYWYCEECGQVWTDEALTQLSNIKNVQIGKIDHTLLVHMDAVEPGCHYDGNIEYWVCYACEQVWQDEDLTQLTNIKNVVLPATNTPEAIHVEAKAATCFEEGNVEYWYCENCEQVWTDEALTQLSNMKNVKVAALEHANIIHIEAVEPGCHYIGNVEHWYCADCEQLWTDEALTQLSNHKNVIIPATGDDSLLVHMDAVAPACHYDGNMEYWVCYACEQVWQDEALTQLTNIKNVVVPATGEGEVVYVEAVKPGCETEGNVEYWYCKDCDQVWIDEALTQLSNRMSVKLGIAHNLVHMDAVAPACHYNGNVEYWYCADCGGHWLDELCHQVTNSKNIVVPAVGGDVVHVPAAEPTCQNGNIEFWFCEECEQVWQNEALTQLTNFKNVIVPATGAHVIDTDTLVWSWATVKEGTKSATNKGVIATASAFCSGCNAEVVLTAEVSDPRTIVATHKDYNNIKTEYHYYTATVTFEGKEYSNVMVIVDPTCRHVGFTGYFGRVQIGNTVKVFPEFKNDYDVGSGWGIYNVVAKEAHNWVEKGKPGDADYVKYCSECALDYKNVATGDAIMFSVIIMILAGAAVVVMLSKKRRVA